MMKKNVHDLLASKVYFIGYANILTGLLLEWKKTRQGQQETCPWHTRAKPASVGVDYRREFHYREPRALPVASSSPGNNFTRVTTLHGKEIDLHTIWPKKQRSRLLIIPSFEKKNAYHLVGYLLTVYFSSPWCIFGGFIFLTAHCQISTIHHFAC